MSAARHCLVTAGNRCPPLSRGSLEFAQISFVLVPTPAWPGEGFQLEPRHRHGARAYTSNKHRRVESELIANQLTSIPSPLSYSPLPSLSSHLVFLQCFLEPIRCLINLLPVSGHAAKTKITVHVAWMLLQNALIKALSSLKLTHSLVQPTKVVSGGHGYATVVDFILDGLLLAAVQRLLIE